ncbi:hypothetical protein [Streptomyces sp. NPDC002763]|uniref:oxidoreductase n=1 Tax=Streptomyces sp. NPDC002763 TaxID=3154427 RepID=UPI003324BB86
MTTLFDRHHLGGPELPDRVVMAPMTRVRAGVGSLTTPSMAAYHAQRTTAGLIVTDGGVAQPDRAVQAEHPGPHTDEQVASWRPVTDAVHANDGHVFAQIMHGGEVFTPAGPRRSPTPWTSSKCPTSPLVRERHPKQADRTAADHWLDLGADLIGFDSAFVANPGLVERLRTGLPLAPAGPATYDQGGDTGHLTCPAYQYTA